MLQEYKKIIKFQKILYDMMHIRYLNLYDMTCSKQHGGTISKLF